MNTIVNAIDTHLPEQIQLSTNVKEIARHSTSLDNYSHQDNQCNTCDVISPTHDSYTIHTHHSSIKAFSITENGQAWITTWISPSNRRGTKNNHSNFNTPMTDNNIDPNQPSIQQAYDCREVQCTGKRHNTESNTYYKEKSRERLGFITLRITINNLRMIVMMRVMF